MVEEDGDNAGDNNDYGDLLLEEEQEYLRGAETRRLMTSVTNGAWSTPSWTMGMTCVSRSGLTNSLNSPYQH